MRKPCSKCGGAQAVRPGGLCNKCFAEEQRENAVDQVQRIQTAEIIVPPGRDRDMGDLEGDAATIRRDGLRHPIFVSKDLHLICGLRRLRMCRDILGWDAIPAFVYPESFADIDPLKLAYFVQSENDNRKDTTHSEKVAFARQVESLLGGRNHRPAKTDEEISVGFPPHLSEQPSGKSRDIAAKSAGFSSTDTYRAAAAVVDTGDEELIGAMDRGELAPTPAAEIAKLPPEERPEAIQAKQTRKRENPGPNRADAPQKKNAAKPEIQDGLGQPIPQKLRDLFASPVVADAAEELREHAKQLHALYRRLLSLRTSLQVPWIQHEAFQQIEQAVQLLKDSAGPVAHGIPFCVHKKCHGKGCEDCENSGYWPRWRHDNHQERGL